MRSLFVKLLLAFAMVILIGTVVDSYMISRATRGQFSRYVTASGEAWARQIAPAVAELYARTGDWEDVASLLQSPWMGMMGSGMRGMNGSTMMGPGMMAGDMWAAMGLRLLLADAQGAVVVDTSSAMIGGTLQPADMAAGIPIEIDGQRVGTLLAVSVVADISSPAGDFLREVNRSTWVASLAAGVLALVLGVILFRHIVAPIRQVTVAAQRIVAGQLDQRAPVTSRDEIGQLAAAFNQMADALVQDQRLRRSMIADIAHELRTPLSVIQANLEAMQDGVLPANPQEIALLHEESMLLARLVADLRLLSLAEAGQLKLELGPVNLGEVVGRVIDRMRLQAEAREVTLEIDLAPDLPEVFVDADRIGQVIGNLLDNALRYTPARGFISVRGFARSEAGAQATVVIEVADSGQGISPEDLPHVFDRFYRADKSRNRASGGSGLGLALARQLVEAHGGRVWVKSEPGAGAVFSFSLPAAQAPNDA